MNQDGGQHMTREEFGFELFEAIQVCAAAQQLLRMIAADVNKGKDTAHLAEEYQSMKAHAKKLVQSESISGQDAARLAREYPWLLA